MPQIRFARQGHAMACPYGVSQPRKFQLVAPCSRILPNSSSQARVPVLQPTLAHGNDTVDTDDTSDTENFMALKIWELRGAKNQNRPENRKSVAFCPIFRSAAQALLPVFQN